MGYGLCKKYTQYIETHLSYVYLKQSPSPKRWIYQQRYLHDLTI